MPRPLPPPNSFPQELRELFDRALAAPRGVSMEFPSRTPAAALRFRLHQLRASERRVLAEAHGPNTPCAWDELVLSLRHEFGKWRLEIVKGGGLYIPEVKEV